MGAREHRIPAPGKCGWRSVPRKVSIDASGAGWIIEENRAFYAFLKRAFALEQADACLRVLGGDAVKKLEAALSDPSKFGMAKALILGGREAGFDMDSREGIEAWMRVMQSQPPPASVRLPALGALARRARRADDGSRTGRPESGKPAPRPRPPRADASRDGSAGRQLEDDPRAVTGRRVFAADRSTV